MLGDKFGRTALLLVSAAAGAALIFYLSRPAAHPPAPAAAPAQNDAASPGGESAAASHSVPRAAAAGPAGSADRRDDLLAALKEKLAAGATLDAIQAVLDSVAKTNAPLAMDLAQAIARDDSEKYRLTSGVLRDWVRTDAQAACQWAFQQNDSLSIPGQPAMGDIALSQMAATDPHAMLAWAETAILNHDTSDDGQGISPRQVAGSAIDALVKLGYPDLARDTIERWAKNPDHPEIGNTAFESVALNMSKASPSDAAAWLLSLPASSDRNYALGTLAASWADSDPQAAMASAYGLADADGRADVMERAFNRWSQKDLPGATAWLDDHQSDPATVHMVTDLVEESGLAYSNPRVALAWAEWIPDPDLRLQTIEQTVIDWARQDPENAKQYVQDNTKLTPEQKAQVLESMHGWKNMSPD